jgi:drug/metabolite transporter (DMT)-like permease
VDEVVDGHRISANLTRPIDPARHLTPMTAGTGYALVAMVCYGLGDFIYKRSATNGVKPLHFLTAQAWVFCPLSFLYAAGTGTLALGIGALWGGFAGLFILIGFNAFLRSLTTGPVSINAPIFRLSFLITAALAVVVLGEPVTAAKLGGLALALVAIWLLLGGGGHGALSQQSLVQVAIATAALGISNFCHKMGLHLGATPETGVAAQAAVFCSLATLTTVVGDRGYRLPHATWTHSVLAALVLLCAFLLLLHALAVGPASVLVPIAQMGFIVTAGLGVALLGEPLTPRKLVGLAAAIAALTALAWA